MLPGLGETQGLVGVPRLVGTEDRTAVGDERLWRAEPIDRRVEHGEEGGEVLRARGGAGERGSAVVLQDEIA